MITAHQFTKVLKVGGGAMGFVHHLSPARQHQSYAPGRPHQGTKRYRSISVLFAALLLGMLIVATASAQTAGWQPVGQRGFSASSSVYDTRLALDPSGTPYVVFREQIINEYKATVMRYTGTAWEVVGSPGFSAGTVGSPSLAVDAQGRPYVAYEDAANGYKATVMRYDGTAWQPVGNPGFSGWLIHPSLALDAQGRPLVAYTDASDGYHRATVMRYNGTAWEPVGPPRFTSSYANYVNLALDEAGTVYVAYADGAHDSKATVMRYNGTGWEVVGMAGFSAGRVSYLGLAWDAVADRPVVAYTDPVDGKATVMRYDGAAWEPVGPRGFTSSSASWVNLALDPAGTPYVAYSNDSNNYSANVMRYNGTDWEVVGAPDFSGSSAWDLSLALNTDGAPYVAYRDGAAGHKVTVMGYRVAPVANPGGPYLGAVNTAISFDGSLSSDPEGDSLTYAWDFGDGSATGTGAMPTHAYTAAGVYNVCLTVNDGVTNSAQVCAIAVVYDPSAGFVTGGGRIESPAGAYKADASLTGQATFGFLARYKRGETVPSGNTAFAFVLAGMAFASESYDWLVVNQAGTNAQFKGNGTVNGALDSNGNAYKFMLWAGDGSPDTFRIRIWWEDAAGEHDVYDNGAAQAIGGGNIVVHTGR